MSDHEMFYTVEQVTTEATVFTDSMSWCTVKIVSKKDRVRAFDGELVVESTIEDTLSGSTAAELRMYAEAVDQIEAGIEWGYMDEPSPAMEPEPLPEVVPFLVRREDAPPLPPGVIITPCTDELVNPEDLF